MVFVIESAATNRSFRRFLGTPGKQRQFHIELKTCALSPPAEESCQSEAPDIQVLESLCYHGVVWILNGNLCSKAGAFSPWAKASSTSPPTPARQSCGVWVGVDPAEVERMGMGMEQPAPWLGEEWGEPPDWDCNIKTSVIVTLSSSFWIFMYRVQHGDGKWWFFYYESVYFTSVSLETDVYVILWHFGKHACLLSCLINEKMILIDTDKLFLYGKRSNMKISELQMCSYADLWTEPGLAVSPWKHISQNIQLLLVIQKYIQQ